MFENHVVTGSLFSPGWPQTCSPSASASLMFGLHGCTSIFNVWENLNDQSLSCYFFSLRNGHLSTEACRNEQKLGCQIQVATLSLLTRSTSSDGLLSLLESVSVISELVLEYIIALSPLVITCNFCLAFKS